MVLLDLRMYRTDIHQMFRNCRNILWLQTICPFSDHSRDVAIVTNFWGRMGEIAVSHRHFTNYWRIALALRLMGLQGSEIGKG